MKIESSKLTEMIQKHSDWLNSKAGGIRADLSFADLGGADLRKADLRGADLSFADLGGADLRKADLRGADLSKADLRGADLSFADLGGADLRKNGSYWEIHDQAGQLVARFPDSNRCLPKETRSTINGALVKAGLLAAMLAVIVAWVF